MENSLNVIDIGCGKFAITENGNGRRIYIMVVNFVDTKKKKLNTSKIKELTLKMSDIIGDAELTEMEDGDILMDSVSEAKVKEIEGLIHLEYLKAGYKIEEIMSNKFTVETGNKDTAELNRLTRVITLHDMWNRQYHNTVSSLLQKHKSIDDWSQDELMKIALCGVKYIKYVADIERENQKLDQNYNTPFSVKEAGFNLVVALFGIIGRIKLNNLIKIFPIDKTYDGDKWGCKDYFYTMDVLKEKGLDNAVGCDGVFDLMWDYENRDLREFTVFYMSCMSAMYKQQTGVSFAEKFCEDNGMGIYTMDRENGLLIDNQTGEIAKVSNKPSFMQIVK